MVGGEHSLTISAPYLLRLGCFEDFEEKDQRVNELINESVTKLFVEQPWLHRVCQLGMQPPTKPI